MSYKHKPLIYVAAPLTTVQPEAGAAAGEFKNVHDAINIGEQIWDMGGVAFVPHLSAFWYFAFPYNRNYDHWLDYDFNIIDRCDALFRGMGVSKGADKEVAYATSKAIPVFHNINNLREWIVQEYDAG